MRALALVAVAAATLAAAPSLAAREKLSGEDQLAKLLAGREAGAPVSCIPLHATRDTRVINGTAIVYDAGGTIYVNRPRNAADLNDDDIMVTDLYGASLCRKDIVRMHDRVGFWYNGFIGLGDFVPYRKVKTGGS